MNRQGVPAYKDLKDLVSDMASKVVAEAPASFRGCDEFDLA